MRFLFGLYCRACRTLVPRPGVKPQQTVAAQSPNQGLPGRSLQGVSSRACALEGLGLASIGPSPLAQGQQPAKSRGHARQKPHLLPGSGPEFAFRACRGLFPGSFSCCWTELPVCVSLSLRGDQRVAPWQACGWGLATSIQAPPVQVRAERRWDLCWEEEGWGVLLMQTSMCVRPSGPGCVKGGSSTPPFLPPEVRRVLRCGGREVSVGSETSASGTHLISGPGAVLPVGPTSGRECPDLGDKASVNDARRSPGGTVMPPVSLVWFLLSVWGSREGMRSVGSPQTHPGPAGCLSGGHTEQPREGPSQVTAAPSQAFLTRLDKDWCPGGPDSVLR